MRALEQIERTYGKEDNILFVMAAAKGDVFTPEILATIETNTERSWFVPNSRRVDSLINYLYPVEEGDDIDIGALIADNVNCISHIFEGVARFVKTVIAAPL